MLTSLSLPRRPPTLQAEEAKEKPSSAAASAAKAAAAAKARRGDMSVLNEAISSKREEVGALNARKSAQFEVSV